MSDNVEIWWLRWEWEDTPPSRSPNSVEYSYYPNLTPANCVTTHNPIVREQIHQNRRKIWSNVTCQKRSPYSSQFPETFTNILRIPLGDLLDPILKDLLECQLKQTPYNYTATFSRYISLLKCDTYELTNGNRTHTEM